MVPQIIAGILIADAIKTGGRKLAKARRERKARNEHLDKLISADKPTIKIVGRSGRIIEAEFVEIDE